MRSWSVQLIMSECQGSNLRQPPDETWSPSWSCVTRMLGLCALQLAGLLHLSLGLSVASLSGAGCRQAPGSAPGCQALGSGPLASCWKSPRCLGLRFDLASLAEAHEAAVEDPQHSRPSCVVCKAQVKAGQEQAIKQQESLKVLETEKHALTEEPGARPFASKCISVLQLRCNKDRCQRMEKLIAELQEPSRFGARETRRPK